MSDKPRDYCGIFGIFDHPDASAATYYGLHALQHRGQESAGIVTSCFDEKKNKPVMPMYKDFGLVLNVFDKPEILSRVLQGRSAIGHNRYAKSKASKNPVNIQPFRVQYKDGNLAVAHNGEFTNAASIRARFREEGVLFQTGSDTELVLHLISHSTYTNQVSQIMDALEQLEGAYCLVFLTDDKLIAARDPNGFRPLALGKKDGKFCIASETCAFDINKATYIRDIKPGEVVVIDREATEKGEPKSFMLKPKEGTRTAQCIFEYVYFSRPDSIIFGEMVDKVRRKLGKVLAAEHPLDQVLINKNYDKKPIIISVPDSSNSAALGYASENQKNGIDCKYDIGIIRNHYVGRTFIAPGQSSRELKVRTKFNPVKGVIEGRAVIIVDDSVVRGTTSRLLVDMIRACNPAEIHFLVSSPPVRFPCYYGMDFPDPAELIANKYNNDTEAVARAIGVDSLRYLSIEGMVKGVREANPSPEGYCTACFTGDYPVQAELNNDIIEDGGI